LVSRIVIARVGNFARLWLWVPAFAGTTAERGALTAP